MPKTLMVQLDLPKDWRTFRMPRGLQTRLQELLDRQDQTGKLTRRERQESNGLVELAEMLTLMKLRVRSFAPTELHSTAQGAKPWESEIMKSIRPNGP